MTIVGGGPVDRPLFVVRRAFQSLDPGTGARYPEPCGSLFRT